jgi:hypothetical protein
MDVGALTESGNKALGSRTLVNLLPPVILAVVLFVLIAAGAPGIPSAAVLVERLKEFDGAQVALLFLGVVVLAVILQPFQIFVVQLLEGYWVNNPITWSNRASLASRAFDVGAEVQRRRYRRLRVIAEEVYDPDEDPSATGRGGLYEEVIARLHEQRGNWASNELLDYPDDAKNLQPTRLGNVLRAAEERAGGRYGLLTNVVYPRLQSLLPERLAGQLANATDQLDLAAHLCVTFLAATVVSSGLLLPNGWRSNLWWMTVPLVTGLLAWLSYRAALQAAKGQGLLLDTAFDLHRFDLLTALHYRLPDDPWSEHRFNARLSRFLRYASRTTRPDEMDGTVPPTQRLLDDDYEHPGPTPQDVSVNGSTRRPGPFQPSQWDWDAIFAGADDQPGNGGGQPQPPSGG